MPEPVLSANWREKKQPEKRAKKAEEKAAKKKTKGAKKKASLVSAFNSAGKADNKNTNKAGSPPAQEEAAPVHEPAPEAEPARNTSDKPQPELPSRPRLTSSH